MIDLETIKSYLNLNEIELKEEDKDYHTCVLKGTVAFVEEKCNIEITNNSSPSILLLVSKLFRYNLLYRPHLKDMKTDDMELEFSTDYPDSLMKDLIVHRKVKW